MKQPEIVNATQAELDEILALAKASFPQRQYQLLEGVLGTFAHVMLTLQNAKTSIKRFRQMLFGARTERKRDVLADHVAGTARIEGEVESEGDGDGDGDGNGAAPAAAPRSGHGRNPAQAYRGAPIVECEHPDLRSGDPCPQCPTGKVYDSPPRTIVKVVGQAPLAGTVYKLRCLRCRLCDTIFTAPLPAAVAALPKYDPSCASMIALLRYGSGVPNYRLEGLQACLYVPLPDSTQWDLVSKAAPGPRAAFEELIRQAAQAPLLHNDDTPARVLSLMAERVKAEAAGRTPKAKAINTTGIVAVVQERKVVLFFTGHAHAGKNLERVLAQRARDLAPPMQMCDALTSNMAGEFATVLAHCLAHGRRKVVDVVEHFPRECRQVIEVLAKVYAHDAACRKDQLSPERRLSFHQEHSGPLMQGLLGWMTEQFDKRQVEPNSGLGQALRYLLNHWNELTLFLRRAGAPLDNNICERALKRAILQRKNSMFYKTLNGAAVGDMYMSLIHTCRLCEVNPFEYLQVLQRHAQEVRASAALWLPWNYREQLPGAA